MRAKFVRGISPKDSLKIGRNAAILEIGGVNITVFGKGEILTTYNLIPFDKYFGDTFEEAQSRLLPYLNKMGKRIYHSVLYNRNSSADKIDILFRDENNKFFDEKTQEKYKNLFDLESL